MNLWRGTWSFKKIEISDGMKGLMWIIYFVNLFGFQPFRSTPYSYYNDILFEIFWQKIVRVGFASLDLPGWFYFHNTYESIKHDMLVLFLLRQNQLSSTYMNLDTKKNLLLKSHLSVLWKFPSPKSHFENVKFSYCKKWFGICIWHFFKFKKSDL